MWFWFITVFMTVTASLLSDYYYNHFHFHFLLTKWPILSLVLTYYLRNFLLWCQRHCEYHWPYWYFHDFFPKELRICFKMIHVTCAYKLLVIFSIFPSWNWVLLLSVFFLYLLETCRALLPVSPFFHPLTLRVASSRVFSSWTCLDGLYSSILLHHLLPRLAIFLELSNHGMYAASLNLLMSAYKRFLSV